MGDVDISLRALVAAHPDEFAQGLFMESRVRFVGWCPTNLAIMERRGDEALELEIDDERVLSHTELELAWAPDVDERMYEYNTAIVQSQLQRIAAQRKAQREARAAGATALPAVDPLLPVESTLVLLSGPREGVGDERSLRTSRQKSAFHGVRYRVVTVYLMRTEALLALPGPLWTVFAPIAGDASEGGVEHAVAAAQARASSAQEYADLLATMAIVAESRGATQAIQERLMKAIEEQGLIGDTKVGRWLINKGLDQGRVEGRVEGLGPLVHQFERRLRRAMTDAERLALATRLDALGAAVLGDIVLDLDDAALAAWVAKLNA